MFILDLLVLALHPVIFPDPGMEGVLIDPKVTGRLGNGLIRLDRQFYCSLLNSTLSIHAA